MKDKTKQNIVLGGVVLAGAWYLTQGTAEDTGGFGGGGGIPLLPGDMEEAAEGDTVINYILGGEPTDPFGGFGDGGEPKKSSIAPTVSKVPFAKMVKDATPAESAFLGMATSAVPHPGAFDESTMGKDARILGKKDTPDTPTQWGEASASGFLEFLAPITQLGKGAVGRSSVYDRPPLHGKVSLSGVSKSVLTKRVSTRKAIETTYASKKGAGSSGRYWRMTGGATHAPGWKQIGAREPTAPGQPDIY